MARAGALQEADKLQEVHQDEVVQEAEKAMDEHTRPVREQLQKAIDSRNIKALDEAMEGAVALDGFSTNGSELFARAMMVMKEVASGIGSPRSAKSAKSAPGSPSKIGRKAKTTPG